MAKSILLIEGMQEALAGKIVISICAGVTIAQLKSWVPPSTTVIRAMPNTPSKVSFLMTKPGAKSPMLNDDCAASRSVKA
jgi:pyrroline-5-carboxylate reductase